jgi:anaerobic ribonucleoside-triphosphate reductase activating protein
LADIVRVDRVKCPVTVLGPFTRAVFWVQGCDLGCEGCIADYASDPSGGEAMSSGELAEWALGCEGIEGITISGGEPFQQAAPLAAAIDLIREERDIGVMCFTGYLLEALLSEADAAKLALLHRTDMLVDGPYIRSLHANLLWRGSSNQRIIHLTNRYKEYVDSLVAEGEKSAGLEMFVDGGAVWFAGVPPMPDFVKRFEMKLFGSRGE